MLPPEMDNTSLYLHVPFCIHRCSYCDFNTFAGQERWIPGYVEAICQEIRQVAASGQAKLGQPLPVHTVFFGGGTPSLLSTQQFETILATIGDCFVLQPGAEVTIEANPGTVSPESLAGLRRTGINRLSFGMQSAHPDDLRLLERQHDFPDVIRAVQWARQAGFDNLSLDLIFGLPEQSLERWQSTLEYALALHPEHLSLYCLTIEHGTPLQKQAGHGLVPIPDDDLAADMYEYAMQRLEAGGYVQYEISNWARVRPDGTLFTCQHNLQYWLNRPYLGFGAGAHGFAHGSRTMNVGGIRPFIQRCQAARQAEFPAGPATRRVIAVDTQTEMQEMMMVGLRLTQAGVSRQDFAVRFGQPLEAVFGKEIERLLKAGLLEWREPGDDRLRLTPRGRLLGNQVFMQFVG
jgi:oxygen-independent coproporphyrinogen III oxidase